MRVINELPRLLECMSAWEKPPSRAEFEKSYVEPLSPWLGPMLEDFSGRITGSMFSCVKELEWEEYRNRILRLDPAMEERRLRGQMTGVEQLLGHPLEGEVVLFGSFEMMDGYARFDRGRHRVFLGVDESFEQGQYLDILFSHELTHVVRESRPEVWSPWGLSLSMTHDEFTERLPVVEHLLNEGFACAVSEALNPGQPAGGYAYQSESSLKKILKHPEAVDAVVHEQLDHPDGDYGELYDVTRYRPVVPRYAHYVWAWQWAKNLVRELGGGREGARALVSRCSKDLVASARAFRLPRELE